MTLCASAKRHSSLSREGRTGAAIGWERRLFVCEVVKNVAAGVRARERQGAPYASGLRVDTRIACSRYIDGDLRRVRAVQCRKKEEENERINGWERTAYYKMFIFYPIAF